MTDDFKNFVKNYDKSGKGAEKKKRRDSNRATLKTKVRLRAF